MNTKILVGVIAMSIAGLAQAQSNVTLYGLLDAGANFIKTPNGNVARETSGNWQGSRWGMRGSEDLGGGLKANFVLESGFNEDDGTSGQGGRLFGRRSTVGLAGSFGTIDLGRRDGPLYDFLNVLEPVPDGGGFGLMDALAQQSRGFTRRYQNQFSYETPVLSGFKARIIYALGENNTALGSDKSNGNTVAFNATYTNGPLFVGYAYNLDKNIAVTTAGVPTSTVDHKYNAIGGSYDFLVVKLFGAFYTDKRANTTVSPEINQRIYWLGASAPFGANNIAFDYGQVKDKVSRTTGAADARQWALTYWYNLSKRTNLYAGYSAIENKNYTASVGGFTAYTNGQFDTTTSSTASNSVTANSKSMTFGIRHKF